MVLQARNHRTGMYSDVEMDPHTASLHCIDSAHAEIHEGHAYVAVDYNTALSGRDILIVVPEGCYTHFTPEFSTDARVTCIVYKDPTTSANGTALTRNNRNHNSTRVSLTTVFHTPTVTQTGTNIVDRFMVGSGEKAGGVARSETEMVLAGGSTYLLRFAGTSFIMNLRLLWYEQWS